MRSNIRSIHREHINRAHKAMGIVSRIQDYCDEGPVKVPYSYFLPYVQNPLRSESVAILEQFCTHCREWPSRDTWYYVEEFLTAYEIKRIN